MSSFRKANSEWAKARTLKSKPDKGQPIYDNAVIAPYSLLPRDREGCRPKLKP